MGQQELGYLVEEQVRILARIEELKARVTELEQQLQDSRQEVRHLLHHCRANALRELAYKMLCCFNNTRNAIVALGSFSGAHVTHIKHKSWETF